MRSLVWPVALAGLAPFVLAFQYAELPADNLVQNPWFQSACEFSASGWQTDETADGLSWGSSDKNQNPSPVNCAGSYEGNAARWARQTYSTPEFSPNEDARIWQVVGPVSTTRRHLRFHFLFVAHRMNKLRARIFGAPSADGPWEVVWTPLDGGWLDTGGANAPFDGTCDGGMQDRTCLWDKVTESALGSLDPLEMVSPTGHAYYQIEFLGNYPSPNGTATGDVGAKIVRVYFAASETGTAPTDGGVIDDGGLAGDASTGGSGDFDAAGSGQTGDQRAVAVARAAPRQRCWCPPLCCCSFAAGAAELR